MQTGYANTAFEESQAYQQDRGYAAPPPQQTQQPQQPDPYGTPLYQQYSQVYVIYLLTLHNYDSATFVPKNVSLWSKSLECPLNVFNY